MKEKIGLDTSKEAIIKKWDTLGFLDGLRGPNDKTKDSIAALYCCQASYLIEEDITKDELKKDLSEGL